PTPQAACGCDYAGSGGDRPSGGPSTPDGSPDGGQLPTVWRLRASFTAGGTISATTSRPYSTNAIGLENSTPTSPRLIAMARRSSVSASGPRITPISTGAIGKP